MAMPGVDVAQALSVTIQEGRWRHVEILLSHPTARTAVPEFVTLSSPTARHLQAALLCQRRHQYEYRFQSQMRDAFREAYKLAYSVVVAEDAGELPIGVSELVCEYVVESRGLAQWTVHVQRQVRKHLNKLRRCGQ
eukprot:TRINITY_DN5424_c0_g2_i1.p1 TRINITY_DN5424_c0_g2~~TRINITY_DN5424_c0_g2_i1.p1  ORF type:complete len:136 (+),score=11.18 TRINITY_DN5424_c0_g2_i1:562-969(+)